MSKRKQTDYIVVHSTLTPNEKKISVSTIDEWHRKRGWLSIGYHFVIETDGTVESGRGAFEVGAHVKNMNANTVSVCLVGGTDKKGNPENNFTKEQMDSLSLLLFYLTELFEGAKVVGHCDLIADTECPSFDVKSWWASQQTNNLEEENTNE